jgi:hypothetical protein
MAKSSGGKSAGKASPMTGKAGGGRGGTAGNGSR